MSAAEAYAKRVIERCISDGDETIDISHVELTSISDATIAPLAGLAVFPTITQGVPFEQKDPTIRLFLANNRLTCIPGAIFNIEHLTVLSVRGNNLQELPPSIGKLKNLQTLNIGQNLLHWLPAELLDLMKYKGKLKTLSLHPNPYHQPLLGPGNVLQGQGGAMAIQQFFTVEHPCNSPTARAVSTLVAALAAHLAKMLLPSPLSTLLLLAIPTAVRAVFRDEVGHTDYHHELLGVPQRETTFFHRPRKDDPASLLYTLSDLGVLAAVNPGSGAVLWRQFLNGSVTAGGGLARAGEGENWVASALGGAMHAWDAVSGRNQFWAEFPGSVRDLEIMELTDKGRKDILALMFEEEEGTTVLRRLNAADGSVVWEHREVVRSRPLQVGTNVEKVFIVSLEGTTASYNLKVSVLDPSTGKKVDELVIGAKGDVHSEADIMFVGSNSAAPIIAWTDATRTKLRINVLGTKTRQEFSLADGTVSVEFHAPHLVQSQPHFLVQSRTKTGNRAEVYHVDLKTDAISKAYDLPLLPGLGAFSTSSSGANVYFTRVTADELILISSSSHGVLGRWPMKLANEEHNAVHAVSEVIKKSGSVDSYAIRSAAVTDTDDWVLVRNGEVAWTRPEGLSGAIAATFAELPDSEELAKTLEQEAHSNPLEAYFHRVKRHIHDLRHLPAYLQTIPPRLISSILGTEVTSKDGKLVRDSFGLNKLVILASRRGRLYCLDVSEHGRILWNQKVVDLAAGEEWVVKGMHVEEAKGQITVRGASGEHFVVKTETGEIMESKPAGSRTPIQSTALVDILGDRRVKYKYLNPNSVVVSTVDDKTYTLTVYLLDTVSGDILSSAVYEGVDTRKPVECAMAENWYVCTFFGQYSLQDSPTQSLKGYQITVSDLYESDEPNDRGPLGNADNFSSLAPIDVSTGIARPSVVTATFVLGAPISALQVTQTRQGIASRQVLAYLPESHAIIGLPRSLLEPRRPVGRDPTPAEAEEGLMRYVPAIEVDPKAIITHERDVLGVRQIIALPAVLESTSLIFAYGVDVFGTRVAPSFLFDKLDKRFNKVSLIGTVAALAAGVVALSPMVRRKQINMRWGAPM
ncbi:hypothetical protein P8C59_009491 [Phyllachora maydis]|uniref:ER membrane protein complex subunit 1 n=1 Tax=Phyllachora maydis TaxID=1825666 RepID=A0AAD9MIJ1_9PEZI|nr:hypothetical protein P8C59_009491 [Phyllachora maydis]